MIEQYRRLAGTVSLCEALEIPGLYSSALTQWRRQYQNGALQGLKDDKRGRKHTCDARDQEVERLRRANEQLSKKLSQAELIIDIQKKVAALLGNPIETHQNDEGVLCI